MNIPYKVVEEYIFYVPGIEGTVRGRVTEQVVSSGRMAEIQKNNLSYEQYSWEASYIDGTEQNTHPASIKDAVRALFDHMDQFDASKAQPNKNY